MFELEFKHLSHFIDIEGFFTGDTKTRGYFNKNFSNNSESEIYIKLSSFSVPYFDHLQRGRWSIANFISSLNLETMLREGNANAIINIAAYGSEAEEHHELLELASTYCNWHNQEAFPIYSTSTLLVLKNSIINPNTFDLTSYLDYAKAVQLLRKEHQLERLDFKELDKFFWLYAQ